MNPNTFSLSIWMVPSNAIYSFALTISKMIPSSEQLSQFLFVIRDRPNLLSVIKFKITLQQYSKGLSSVLGALGTQCSDEKTSTKKVERRTTVLPV